MSKVEERMVRVHFQIALLLLATLSRVEQLHLLIQEYMARAFTWHCLCVAVLCSVSRPAVPVVREQWVWSSGRAALTVGQTQ